MQRLGEDGSGTSPFTVIVRVSIASDIPYLWRMRKRRGSFPATGKWMEEGNPACLYKRASRHEEERDKVVDGLSMRPRINICILFPRVPLNGQDN